MGSELDLEGVEAKARAAASTTGLQWAREVVPEGSGDWRVTDSVVAPPTAQREDEIAIADCCNDEVAAFVASVDPVTVLGLCAAIRERDAEAEQKRQNTIAATLERRRIRRELDEAQAALTERTADVVQRDALLEEADAKVAALEARLARIREASQSVRGYEHADCCDSLRSLAASRSRECYVVAPCNCYVDGIMALLEAIDEGGQ